MSKKIDLLNGPIFTSLTGLALPIMATAMVQTAYSLTAMVQTAYSLTDMAWIGMVGSKAVTAVGAASMYAWLSQGVSTLARMGGQVKVAHALGSGSHEEASKYAQGAIQMGIVFAVLYGILAVAAAGPLISFFGLSDPSVITQAELYLKVTCGLILFSYMNTIITGILTAMGDSKTPFLANVIGLVVNMAFDPILIFGIGPFPKLGVLGAAVATVFAQFIVTAVFLVVIRKDKLVFDKVCIWKGVPFDHVKIMVRIGLPAAIQNLIYTSISMVLTRFVAGFGDAAVAVQRVGSQIESISWSTADGFAAAINSFVGQNYGGKRYKRVKKGYFTSVGVMAVWGFLCACLLVFLPEQIFGLFIHEPELVPMGVGYLVILGFSQMFMCVELDTIGALSGLGKTLLCSVISIILTSARIPFAMLFSSTSLGLNGIWWAYTVSSVLKGIIFFLCFLMVAQKLPKNEGLS